MPTTLDRALAWLDAHFGAGQFEDLGRPTVPDDANPSADRLANIEQRLAELLPA